MLDQADDTKSHDAAPDQDLRRSREHSAPEPLAKAFVELLIQDAQIQKAVAATALEDGFVPEDVFGCADGPMSTGSFPHTLTVDEAAAAILLGDWFERNPDMLEDLRLGSPVLLVQAPDERSVSHFAKVVRVCALGRETELLSAYALDSIVDQNAVLSDRRHAVVLECGTAGRDAALLDTRTVTAMSLAVPVCAVAVNVGRSVPELTRSVAEGRILTQRWDANLVSTLLESVTGDRVDVPDEPWIAGVTLDDLRMSVSLQRGGPASLERLRSAVGRRTAATTNLPDLGTLHGYGEASRVASDMLVDIADYRAGKITWSAVPRGLLLAGPTGTGKTFFVRCLARTAELPLVMATLARWQSAGDGHLGDCLKAMHKSFLEARAIAPSILFIDEIDAFGHREQFKDANRDYSVQVVNALLEELDGSVERTGVIVLAATNHVDRIDPAILRPGRLDRLVHVDMPDTPALAGILRTQLGHDLPDADLLPVALAGAGGSGADAAYWIRCARGMARRAGRSLSVADLLTSVRDGRPVVPQADRRRIALHEAAHACAAVALDIGSVQGVSLHDAGGYTRTKPTARTTTRPDAMGLVVHLLAGRAAERHFLGSVSAGAGGSRQSDLALATKVAFSIESSWGLGEIGPMWIGDPDLQMTAFALAPSLAAPVRRLLLHCEREADRLVAANEQAISRCADRLLQSGYLDAHALITALGAVIPFAVEPTVRNEPPVTAPGTWRSA